jgi:tetratricopeptide (TPR) repeat protein
MQATGVTQPQYRPLEDERGSAPAAEAVETAEAPVMGATQPQYRPLEDEQRGTPAAAVVPPAQDVVAKAEPAQMPVAQQPAVEPADPADFQSKLEQARALYWRQDIRGAVQAYQGLTESYPDQAEAWGELGNLYFSMQQSTEAAGAYAQAIELLIAKGDSTSARNLLEAMRRLDPGKASELEMQLR